MAMAMKKQTRKASSSATAMRSVLDSTLLLALTVLLTLSVTVTVRTFLCLPSIPADLSSSLREERGVVSRRANEGFPQSIQNDALEEIIHPAAEVLPGRSDIPPLLVPPFWSGPSFLANGTASAVREYLGNYGERLMTRDEALSIGSFVGDLETIYIAVSSYRDYQCPQTVESIFRRAKHPHRIRVAVVDQIDANVDAPCSKPLKPCDEDPTQALCTHRSQIDVWQMDARYAVGPVFARHLGHRMYRGEYFAMQCDAHMDFVQDWDVDIISQWKSADNEMAVLTAYLSDVVGSIDPVSHRSLRNTRPIMCMSDWEGSGADIHLRHGQQPEGEPGIHGTPTLEPYWAAGFSCSRGHFIVNVPYDQHLPMIFQGEEINIGLRGFTYGYDYYTAERSVCFHYYAHKDNEAARKKVPLFWEHANLFSGAGTAAMKRLNAIIGMNNDNDNDDGMVRRDWKEYGIGKVRTTRQFFDTFGIHVEERTVERHLCQFVGRPMQRMMLPHLRRDGMGIDYTDIHYRFRDPVKFGNTWDSYMNRPQPFK